jgi:molybdate transport system substrate-binding protein
LLLAGCGSQTTIPATTQPAASREVVVFAASSLKDAFEALQDDLKQQGIEKVTYNFAGSQALAAQLGQGARAEVFASADLKNMETAVAAGSVEAGTLQVMATNRLIVIVPPGEGSKVTTLKDLSAPGIKLVLADPSVPAGNYSLQVLDKFSADPAFGTGFKTQVLANVVSRESNVRQVVAKVQLGEADAGIVYTTDARSAAAGATTALGSIEIPESYNVVARYYIARLNDSTRPEAAQLFIDHVLSAQGQQTLAGYGFGPASGSESK